MITYQPDGDFFFNDDVVIVLVQPETKELAKRLHDELDKRLNAKITVRYDEPLYPQNEGSFAIEARWDNHWVSFKVDRQEIEQAKFDWYDYLSSSMARLLGRAVFLKPQGGGK